MAPLTCPPALQRRLTSARHLVLLLLTAAACAPAAAGRAPAAHPAPADPLRIAPLRSTPHDLDGVRVVNRHTAAVFHVYYDSVSAPTALDAATRLHDVYARAARLLAVDPGLVDWAAVAFVADTGYTPPRTGREVRWTLQTDSGGRLSAGGEARLISFIPHEQTHAVHVTFLAAVPRWFSEGLASWVEVRVADQLDPSVATALREKHHAVRGATQHANLAGWGGVSVRPEAILRQVSPEQRERMQRDPTYMPPGPFRFGPGDFIEDLANEAVRYALALDLFERLEAGVGLPRLQDWLRAIWSHGGSPSTQRLVELAAVHTGVDIAPYLR